MNSTLEKSQPTAPPPPEEGFWSGDLGYPQAVVTVLIAFLIGLFYHTRMNHTPQVPPTVAWTAGVLFTAAVAFVALRWRTERYVVWLTDVPFAIVSTVGVCLVAAIGAVVPGPVLMERLHMPSVYASWPFAMVMLTMLVNLIGVSAQRLYPFSWRNLRFSLNHLGLTVVILGGVMSAAGLERVTLELHQGTPSATAQDDRGHPVSLPFTTTLQEFHLKTFPPTLAVAVPDASKKDGYDVKPGESFVKPGMREHVGPYTLAVKKYMPSAALMGNTWQAVPDTMKLGAPAALVAVSDSAGKPLGEGWVSAGSPAVQPAIIRLDDGRAVFMPDLMPREFRSSVVIEQNGHKETREVSVNAPITVAGYRIYQLSYDEQMGPASKISVLEVVRDRGLPVVYTGLYMMIAGAVLMLWLGIGAGAAPGTAGVPGPASAPETTSTPEAAPAPATEGKKE